VEGEKQSAADFIDFHGWKARIVSRKQIDQQEWTFESAKICENLWINLEICGWTASKKSGV
jgi:hypothetical protein